MKICTTAFALLVQLSLVGTLAIAQTTKITGEVSGFNGLDDDDTVNGALVLPSLSADTLLQFNLEGLLSPNEPMEAGPENPMVPGNLFIPEQSHTYIIFPITLKKDNFSLMVAQGAKEELSALWFQVPFSDLVKAMKAKGPFTDMIPLIKIHKLGFEGNRDWSQEPSIRVNLAQDLKSNIPFSWQRSQPLTMQSDLAVVFQRTPANRWIVADIAGNPSPSGSLQSAPGISGDGKVLFARIQNGQDGKPKGMTGYIRNTSDAAISVGEPPDPIQNASIQNRSDGKSLVSWDPIQKTGWMAILRYQGKQEFRADPFDTLESISATEQLACLFECFFSFNSKCDRQHHNRMPNGGPSLEAWVKPTAGSYSLPTDLKQGEKLALLFVGTERDVASPGQDSGAEPALFTYADELRMIRMP